MPQNFAGRRLAESGQNAQQRGFAAAGGAEQGYDFSRLDVEIDGSNHFNAIPIGLVVEFFDSVGADDGLGHGNDGIGHGFWTPARNEVSGVRCQVSGVRKTIFET